MNILGEKPGTCTRTKNIYWTTPEFMHDGSVDVRALQRHLITRVPNNFYDEEKNNVWEPGKEFQVCFLDHEKKNTICFRCALTFDVEDSRVICSLCEQTHTILLVEEIQRATTEALMTK